MLIGTVMICRTVGPHSGLQYRLVVHSQGSWMTIGTKIIKTYLVGRHWWCLTNFFLAQDRSCEKASESMVTRVYSRGWRRAGSPPPWCCPGWRWRRATRGSSLKEGFRICRSICASSVVVTSPVYSFNNIRVNLFEKGNQMTKHFLKQKFNFYNGINDMT